MVLNATATRRVSIPVMDEIRYDRLPEANSLMPSIILTSGLMAMRLAARDTAMATNATNAANANKRPDNRFTSFNRIRSGTRTRMSQSNSAR